MRHIDFLVIGSGPAGQRASIQAAKLGKRVALIERRPLVGGVALHTGTIPSKALREAILYLTGWGQRGYYGRDHRLKSDITAADLRQRLDVPIRHEVELIREQLRRNGVELIKGTASFTGSHTVRIQPQDGDPLELEAEKILIATGTRPRRPDHIPFDDETVIDADGILQLNGLPRTLTVIGAGVIGIEYATMFNTLDIEVTVVNESPTMLGFTDHEILDEFMHYQRDNGMVFRLGEKVAEVVRNTTGKVVTRLANGRQILADVLLFAAGRTGCTASLNLEKAGLTADGRGNLKVDEHFRTAVPHIYAAGDVIGFPSLASTSMEQGRLVALHAFGEPTYQGMSHIPYGIYAVPEISMVGKTEQDLVKEGIAYETGLARFRETARGQILGLREGLLKILVGLEDRRILGVHIVGGGATELVHIGQTAMMLGGTLDYFVNSVFNYPTLAEAYKIAALDAWNRLHH